MRFELIPLVWKTNMLAIKTLYPLLVLQGGNDPPSLGYQPNALPLSYRRITYRNTLFLHIQSVDPYRTSVCRGKCAFKWYTVRDSNP